MDDLGKKNFKPRLSLLEISLTCLVFGFLAFALRLDSENRRQAFSGSPGFSEETALIWIFLASVFVFLISYFLLPLRLKFTESGIRRLTLLPPRFVAWKDVRKAGIANYKGYYSLDLWVGRRRWICVPLLNYRLNKSLFEEIGKRIPVKIAASERQLNRLTDA